MALAQDVLICALADADPFRTADGPNAGFNRGLGPIILVD